MFYCSKSILALVLIVTFVLNTSSVNLKVYNQSEYLSKLVSQQQNLQQATGKLSSNIQNTLQSTQKAKTVEEKIELLEKAIFDQGNDVYNLSTSMIPPLDLSSCNCNNFTSQQRKQLKEKAESAIEKLNVIKQNLQKLDTTTLRVKKMISVTESEQFYLKAIVKVMQSNCIEEIKIKQTVFQSKYQAPNWVVGQQTINDVINDYLQRSMNYGDISNCPDQKPFYDGSNCINCSLSSSPYFNMQTKKCVGCPDGKSFNLEKRNCLDNTIYHSNLFTYIPWVISNSDLTEFLQKYSQTITNSSDQKLCTNNQGQKILCKNGTINGKLCTQDKPFLINKQCSKCSFGETYNAQQMKCIIPQKDKKYDGNIHKHIPPSAFKQTNPSAPKIISVGQLFDDPNIQNCPLDQPYYDGIACIKCPQLFGLFEISTKKCVACDPESFYNQTTKKCNNRPIIYNSDKDDNLLGTPKFSVKDYKDKLQKLRKDPNAIESKCKSGENSKFTHCVQCQNGQHFNVEKLNCEKCNTIVIQQKMCLDGVFIKPNIDIITPTLVGKEPNDAKNYINKIKDDAEKAKNNIYVCKEDKPFANLTSCLKCPLDKNLFDVNKLECTSCTIDQKYNKTTQLCEPIKKKLIYLTHPKVNKNLIGKTPSDVLDYLKKQDQLKKNYPNTQQCPESKPFSNEIQCIQCPEDTPLFNVSDRASQCTKCQKNQPFYDSQKYECKACGDKQFYNQTKKQCQPYKNQTVTNPQSSNIIAESPQKGLKFLNDQKNILDSNPIAKKCPIEKPYYLNGQCIACEGQNSLFDITNFTCTKCPQGSQYSKKEFICTKCQQTQFYNKKNKKCEKIPQCSPGTKFYISTLQCEQICPQNQSWNSTSQKCQEKCNAEKSQVWNPTSKKCQILLIKTSNLRSNENWISSDYVKEIKNNDASIKKGAKPCIADTPFWNGKECVKCYHKDQLFNMDTKKCEICSNDTKFIKFTHQCRGKQDFQTNLNSPNLIYGGYSYTQLKYFYDNNKTKYGTQDCPNDQNNKTPYWDGHNCINCQDPNSYFNLVYRVCDRCQEGTSYVQKNHNCIDKQGKIIDQDPTLAKLAANVFSHYEIIRSLHRLITA